MSKNLTLKGAAFGALVALSISAVAPASAAGLADKTFVSLLPQAGTEYSVFANQTFDLKANIAPTIAGGGNLKFLVADTSSKTRALVQSRFAADITATAYSAVTLSGSTFTYTVANTFKAGDWVTITASGITAGVGSTGTVKILTASSSAFTYAATAGSPSAPTTAGTYAVTDKVSRADIITAAGASSTGVAGIGGTIAASIAGTATDSSTKRAANGSYVLSSDLNTTTSDKVLRLVSNDVTASQSVEVTAWVDSNNDNAIDDTEYTSPTRTVKFLLQSDVTPTVSLDPVTSGATSLTARITTSPVLNGDQVGYANIGAAFTRQDSAKKVVVAASSWSDTTKTFVATKSLEVDNTAGYIYATGATGTTGAWADLVRAGTTSASPSSIVVTSKVALVTTAGVHDLRVGDKVTFETGAATTGTPNASIKSNQYTVTAVPSTTTFKFALDVADGTLAAVAGSSNDTTKNNDYTVTTWAASGGKSVVDRAFSGTYTAQAAAIPATGTQTVPYWTVFGTAVSNSSATKTAASVTVDASENANVGKTGANTTDVRKGTTEATTVVTVLDADSVAVAAGVQVSATVSSAPTGAGTYKINGVTVANGSVVYAATDANGQAKFVVSNSSALANDAIALSFTAEAVTAATETLTWNTAVYSIVDLNDSSSVSAPSRLRSANKGAAVTFDLVVRDQFKQAADSALYRLKAAVTNRTIFTQTYALSAGKATVSVADAQLGAGSVTNVALNIQKLVSGVWTDNAVDADVVDWNEANQTAGNGELGDVLITYYDQTDAIALNANGASTPNTTTAGDLAATVTKGTFTAVDLRVAAGNAPTYAGTSAAGVVSGIVKSSTTAVGRKGSVVTVTGAGLLFNAGDVWAVGSITTLTNTNGFFNVSVYSTTSGDKKVSIASNGATATATVAFTGVATDMKNLTITGAQKVSSGSTLQANILLVDGNGNPVDTTAPATTPAAAYIKVSYDGPGLLSGSALPVETDADGKASVRYLLGVGDKGTATVTVKYDQNYDGDFVDATDITVVRNYVIGVSAKITKAATSSAVVKNAAGATIKVVRGTKSTTKVATSNSQKVTVKGGSGTVKVYVNGVKVASK